MKVCNGLRTSNGECMKSNFLKLLTLASFSSYAFFSSASEQNSTVNVTYDAFGQVVLTSFDPTITSADSSAAIDTLFYEFDPYYKQGVNIEADKLMEVLSGLQGKANFVLRRTPRHHDLQVSEQTANEYMNAKGYEVCFVNKIRMSHQMDECTDSWNLLLDDISVAERNEYLLKAVEKHFPNAYTWQQGDIQVNYDELGQVELLSFDTFVDSKEALQIDLKHANGKIFEFYSLQEPNAENSAKALASILKSIKGKVNFEFSRSKFAAFPNGSNREEVEERIERQGYSLTLTGVGHRYDNNRFGFSSSGFFKLDMPVAERNKFILDVVKELQK